MRVRLAPSEWANGQNPGYYAYNLTLGQERTLHRDNWLSMIGENSIDWLNHLLLIGLGFVAFVLYAAQRRNRNISGFQRLALFAGSIPFPLHHRPS